jgi:hypothetical protein
MRETINDLLGRLGEKKPSEEKHNHGDSGKLIIAILLSLSRTLQFRNDDCRR